MSASDNTSVIDAARTMLKALEDNAEGLEAIWRGAATKDQLQDMINLLELAQVSRQIGRLSPKRGPRLASHTLAREGPTRSPPPAPRDRLHRRDRGGEM